MMAKPMKTLESHSPMIQFFTLGDTPIANYNRIKFLSFCGREHDEPKRVQVLATHECMKPEISSNDGSNERQSITTLHYFCLTWLCIGRAIPGQILLLLVLFRAR